MSTCHSRQDIVDAAYPWCTSLILLINNWIWRIFVVEIEENHPKSAPAPHSSHLQFRLFVWEWAATNLQRLIKIYKSPNIYVSFRRSGVSAFPLAPTHRPECPDFPQKGIGRRHSQNSKTEPVTNNDPNGK